MTVSPLPFLALHTLGGSVIGLPATDAPDITGDRYYYTPLPIAMRVRCRDPRDWPPICRLLPRAMPL